MLWNNFYGICRGSCKVSLKAVSSKSNYFRIVWKRNNFVRRVHIPHLFFRNVSEADYLYIEYLKTKESNCYMQADTIVQSDYLAVITWKEREMDKALQSMFAILMNSMFLKGICLRFCVVIYFILSCLETPKS